MTVLLITISHQLRLQKLVLLVRRQALIQDETRLGVDFRVLLAECDVIGFRVVSELDQLDRGMLLLLFILTRGIIGTA